MSTGNCRILCLSESGGATWMTKWLMGMLMMLASLHTVSCNPQPGTKADRAPSGGQNAAAPPKKPFIINALLASTRTAPPGGVNSNEALPDTMRLPHEDPVAHPGAKRVQRAFKQDVDEFSTAWRTLDWEHHWGILLLTLMVAGTTLVLVSVVVAVTCSPHKSQESRESLESLKLENAVRGRFLFARRLWRAKQKEKAKAEESRSLLERSASVDSTKRGQSHQSLTLPPGEHTLDFEGRPLMANGRTQHGSGTSQKHDKTYRQDNMNSESSEQISAHKKMSSRRQKPKSSSSTKRSHKMLRHEMVGVYK